MGWLKRRWQDDEEAIARMASRYAATGDPVKDKKPAKCPECKRADGHTDTCSRRAK